MTDEMRKLLTRALEVGKDAYGAERGSMRHCFLVAEKALIDRLIEDESVRPRNDNCACDCHVARRLG